MKRYILRNIALLLLAALLLSLTGCGTAAEHSAATEAQKQTMAEAQRLEMIPVTLTGGFRTWTLEYDDDGQLTGYTLRERERIRHYVLDRKERADGTWVITVLRAPGENPADVQETLPIIYTDEAGRLSKIHQWMTLLTPDKLSKSFYGYTYDEQGRLKTRTYTENGETSTMQYQWDDQGHLVQSTGSSATTLVERNAYGDIIGITQTNNGTNVTDAQKYYWQYQNGENGLKMKLRISAENGCTYEAVTYLYDAKGKLCGMEEPLQKKTIHSSVYSDRALRWYPAFPEIFGTASRITWMTPEAYRAQAEQVK